MNDNKKEECDLCGLKIEVSGFNVKTQQGDKHFCCEGCMGIFQMLSEDDVLTDQNDIPQQTRIH